MIKLVKSEYVVPQTKAVGVGGEEVWTFKALKAGETNISFKYVRPWEKDVAPAETKTIKVIIKSSPNDSLINVTEDSLTLSSSNFLFLADFFSL